MPTVRPFLAMDIDGAVDSHGMESYTVHFGYSGHLGPPFSGHYIRPEYDRINVFCTKKSCHYIRMATLNVTTISGVHCNPISQWDSGNTLFAAI